MNHPEFLMHYLRYCAVRGILTSIATGTTILHLPEEQLAALVLPFPPNEEQQKIADLLNSAQNAIKSTKKRIEEDSERHQTLLSKVFEVTEGAQ